MCDVAVIPHHAGYGDCPFCAQAIVRQIQVSDSGIRLVFRRTKSWYDHD